MSPVDEDDGGASDTASAVLSVSHTSSPHKQTHAGAASITHSHSLPSLLLGVRTISRSSSPTTAVSRPVTAVSSAPAGNKTSPHDARVHSVRSSSSSLALYNATSSTTAAVASPMLHRRSGSRAGSSGAANDDDSDEQSDASSEFEGLLERVGAGKRSREPSSTPVSTTDTAHTPQPAPLNSDTPQPDIDHGQELAAQSDQTLQQLVASKKSGKGLLDTSSGVGLDEDDSASDADACFVDRAQRHPDPRVMLREQLKRSESAGRPNRQFLTSSDLASSVPSIEGPTTSVQRLRPRQYYMLSAAGKLIFTTEQEEEEATSFVGVMQAIISIFADENDKLRHIDAGDTRISFVLKYPVYLVAVSNWGEPEALRTHLEYLYLQVLSVITHSQLTSIFSKRQNFDLRRLLEGTEAFFSALTATLQASLSIFTNSLEVYRIDTRTRDDVAKALAIAKSKTLSTSLSVLYVMVISSSRLVTLLRPPSHSIHPADLHLLLSTIASSKTFTTPDGESWIPVCLPRFNNKGFLHAYIGYVTESTGVVLIGAERDKFDGVKAWAEDIKRKLKDEGLLHKLEKHKAAQTYSLAELAVPGLRHFLYKSKVHVQITQPAYEGDYEVDGDNRRRLITLYQIVHESLHPRPSYISSLPNHIPAKLAYVRTEHEAVLGWATSKFELYVAVSPLLPKTAVVSVARAVTRWIKPEEHFLISAPSF
ncbi:Vacuolar fusion protein mon1 [Microbotryomycetes sp. JL201]|nr:Vacuolar fusion protein mon1 [Microbotryomycetes sp. JL201]